MMRNNLLIKTAVFVLLALFTATSANGEYLGQRVARGNNVGLGLMTDWCTPMITASWTGNTIQYPKGSGNLILNDAWTVGMMTANDLDGDGTPEDTAVLGSGGRDNMPYRCSIEAYDVLTALANSGENMETAASARAGTGINRVWTSVDAGELEEWPIEARHPHTASGTPIIHGAETMFLHTGDVFNSWGAPLSGFYMGWSFYFLDFAESNSMVYVHQYIQNVTEYMHWNPSYGGNMWYAGGAAPAGGWTWKGMILFNNWRQMGFGRSSNLGWCYHPEKEIIGLWCRDPQVSNWTPSDPPLMALKVLKYPELNGEQIGLQNIHTVSGTEFGFSGAGNLLAMGLSYPKVYSAVMNTAGLYTGQINPFTEEPATDGYPGVLTPEHDRYSQWIWGGSSNWNHYTFWGELHDVAPRDTMNLDWCFMFAPTGVTPLIAPTYDIANIDDPMMQEAFAPLEHYTSVAQTTYDGGFVVPNTPSAPALTIVPGDREVTITWSDINPKTPDEYYYFLQENPHLDPNGVYREYDFEGFRLYRSYVGPNDSHSEMIWSSSISGGDLQFYYIDKLEDDQPLFRMRNGLKVWYALVPYDRNYDPSTGEMFSLPAPESGKVWNRAGEAGLYLVMPRSEASNFVPASFGGSSFSSGASVSLAEGTTAMLSASDGVITATPVVLEPQAAFTVDAVTAEKITSDQNLSLVCVGMDGANWGGCNYPNGLRQFELRSGGSTVTSDVILPNVHRRGASNTQDVLIHGPIDDDGVAYAITATFDGVSQGDWRSNLYYNWDQGSWTGGSVAAARYRCGSRIGSAPNMLGWTKSAKFEITWADAGDGGLTVSVNDLTYGESVPFGEQPDDYGWGFAPGDIIGDRWGSADNLYNQMVADIPKAERTNKMVSSLPADNTEGFGIWLNGIFWVFSDVTAMPAPGTTMTMTTAWGSWNGDGTAWIQTADAPMPGDSWNISITATTMEPEDADLSKIRVVPNPYVASSFLDLSITQRRIEFVNLPDKCTIRIYSLGGNLVNVLNHIGVNRLGWGDYTDWDRLTQGVPKELNGYDNHGGTEAWNLRNRFGQTVASGLYFFHVTDSRGETYTGKFYVIN